MKKIGFFDLFLDISYRAEDLVSVDKDIYYRDVHLFMTQIVNIIRIKSTALVVANLHICLCETALQ